MDNTQIHLKNLEDIESFAKLEKRVSVLEGKMGLVDYQDSEIIRLKKEVAALQAKNMALQGLNTSFDVCQQVVSLLRSHGIEVTPADANVKFSHNVEMVEREWKGHRMTAARPMTAE